MYDYFYGAESEQFSFYRIPKMLFTNERFKTISAEAKILYGLLLDRMNRSAKNGWQDEKGRIFIHFKNVGCVTCSAFAAARADISPFSHRARYRAYSAGLG